MIISIGYNFQIFLILNNSGNFLKKSKGVIFSGDKECLGKHEKSSTKMRH